MLSSYYFRSGLQQQERRTVYSFHNPTGACHCQILDWVIPGSVDMTKVKFDAQSEDDCRHNFSLVLEAFSKNSITTVSIFLNDV